MNDPLVIDYITDFPQEVVGLLQTYTSAEQAAFLSQLPTQYLVILTKHFDSASASRFLVHLPFDQVRDLLISMQPKEAAQLLSHIKQPERSDYLQVAPPHTDRWLQLEPNSIGLYVDLDATCLQDTLSVGQALTYMKRLGREASVISYVTSDDQEPIGWVDSPLLFSADANSRLYEVARPLTAILPMGLSLYTVARFEQWQWADELPTIHTDGKFAGVLRHATIRRVLANKYLPDENLWLDTVTALIELFTLGMGDTPSAQHKNTGGGDESTSRG